MATTRLWLTVSALALAACTAKTNPFAQSVGHGAVAEFQGEVTETLEVSGYRYVRVRALEGDERWVATLALAAAPQGAVTVHPFGQLDHFTSPRLHRTFSPLWFAVVSPHPHEEH